MNFDTLAIHAGTDPHKHLGAAATPIYQTSTFAWKEAGTTHGYDYSRSGNPTREALENNLAVLEKGHAGFAFATGMAAEATVMYLVKPGDHVIAGDDIYGGTYRLFDSVLREQGIEFDFVRMDKRENIEKALKPNTKMIWVESPSNPLLNIVDMEMVVNIAHEYNLVSVTDNTFSSPVFLRPIEYGVDIVVHSTTKYLNGHCDVVGGAVVTRTPELSQRIKYLMNALGTCASPFDSFLVLRGIKTLPVRMRQHEENGRAVAEFLSTHPKVKKTYYPGLPEHPCHELALKQQEGFGGIVSFEIKRGELDISKILNSVRIFEIAESLGGVTSLIEHPATMSHASMPKTAQQKAGITENLIRLSLGLEDKNDLIEDLNQALYSKE